ncbi:type II secretion system F family protein [Jannaschia seohaensis]|uniref:General secretion pathway protein F n=1 Tax=Jannaschia seohaensis TaxID=475081 RepID=A0A2Y9C2D1_9RHOB|nr:type II secretion system F family protein [Jannaschia seohaensis]PWJ15802.1 general secretion pathway protein F [Jannaschia seohaensis]SSA49492.1 general secretion pathway protein F [Jannaschia seohaensis]
MNVYGYTAFTADGKRRRGTVLAETESHASDQLRREGLFVSELEARGARAPRRLGRARLSPDLRAVMTRQMAVLLAAELPAEAALEAVRQGEGALDAVAARARAALMEGASLSEALAGSGGGFAPYYLASVRAGETAGDLAAVFEELAEHLETQRIDRAQIASALIYPAFVAAVSLLVCAILMVSVAPEIVAMFEISGRPLPVLTQYVLAVSDWVQAHLLWVGVGAAALVALWLGSTWLPGPRAVRDRLFLRIPLVGRFLRLAEAVQYLRTLALVLSSRHTALSAVENAAQVLTIARFRTEAEAVATAIRQGETLSDALRRISFVPPVARQLIGAGEASARLARMTERAAVLVETGLSTERKRIAALLEPILMMLVGVFVLVIVLAVLLPIFDLQAVVAG